MKHNKEKINNLESVVVEENCNSIELTFKSFGFGARIVEVEHEKKYTEYRLEVAIGTNLRELEKLDRNIALAVASSTGKVEMILPIPGRHLIGIRIPKYSKEYLLKIKKQKEQKK